MAVQERPTSALSRLEILNVANVANAAAKSTRRFTLDNMCRDELAVLALSLLRFVGTAYATGDANCWEEAHRLAEDIVRST